jgi:hypothetical protein
MKDIYDEWIDPQTDGRSSEFTIDYRKLKRVNKSLPKSQGVFASPYSPIVGHIKLSILVAYLVLNFSSVGISRDWNQFFS